MVGLNFEKTVSLWEKKEEEEEEEGGGGGGGEKRRRRRRRKKMNKTEIFKFGFFKLVKGEWTFGVNITLEY